MCLCYSGTDSIDSKTNTGNDVKRISFSDVIL